MSIVSRISDLAGAVRDKINAMMPRLMPAGGTSGQVLTKASAADNDAGWQTPAAGGDSAGLGLGIAMRNNNFHF